jgi:hypothetical protein
MVAWATVNEIYGDDNYLNEKANNRHYGAIGINTGFLYGAGGTSNAFTSAVNPTFNSADGRTGTQWERHRQMKNSNFVARCNARGMEVYLGFYQANYDTGYFHAGDWFDDSAWSSYLSTSPADGQKIFSIAAAASRMGCAGLLLDGENYPTLTGQSTLFWDWNYPGNTHTEAQVRAKAKQRGAEYMTCVLAGWAAGGNPNAPKFMQYTAEALAHSYRALMLSQPSGNNLGLTWGEQFLYHDFFSGMCSVAGYGTITHVDAVFDKSPQISGMSWDSAVQYGTNSLAAWMSRYFDAATWKLACKKIGHNAMFWIDQGSTSFEAVMPPSTALAAGQAFRKYGTNGAYTLYGHHLHESYVDTAQTVPYSNYYSTLASITSTTSPDNTVPTLTVSVNASNVLQGTASHPEGVRCVEWERRTGTAGDVVADSGALKMTWASEFITNVSPNFYSNKPMSFGETVSGGAGAWYVVTATSFLGTATSRVVQAPGGTVVTPPEELPEDPFEMWPDVVNHAGTQHLVTAAEVVTAAAQGITLSMNYGSDVTGALETQMIASGVKYLDRLPADWLYATIPSYTGGTITQVQEDQIVSDVTTYMNAHKNDPQLAGWYILDDWPGTVLGALERITAWARANTPTLPTVAAFVAIYDFWPPSDPTHASEPYQEHSAFNQAIVNYSPDACDIVDLYIYGIPNQINFPPLTCVPADDVDWTGVEHLWAYIKSVLLSKGWDPGSGFMFTPQTFVLTNSPYNCDVDYPNLTQADVTTQVRYAVEAGAHSTLSYIWDSLGFGDGLEDRPEWQDGYEDGHGQAKILWRDLPVGITHEYDAREARTLHEPGNLIVSSWDNAAGASNDLDFPQGSPKTTTRNINGNNAIEFGITTGDALLNVSDTLTPPYTLFAYVRSDQTTQTGYVFATNTSINFGQVGTQWQVAVAAPFGGGTVDLDPHVLTLVVNGASSLLYVDGNLVASGTIPATAASVFGFGGDGGSSAFDGVIGHIMIWPGTLFAPDRQAIETYLRDSWA